VIIQIVVFADQFLVGLQQHTNIFTPHLLHFLLVARKLPLHLLISSLDYFQFEQIWALPKLKDLNLALLLLVMLHELLVYDW